MKVSNACTKRDDGVNIAYDYSINDNSASRRGELTFQDVLTRYQAKILAPLRMIAYTAQTPSRASAQPKITGILFALCPSCIPLLQLTLNFGVKLGPKVIQVCTILEYRLRSLGVPRRDLEVYRIIWHIQISRRLLRSSG